MSNGKWRTMLLSTVVAMGFIGGASAQTVEVVDGGSDTFAFLPETGTPTGFFVYGPDTPPEGVGSAFLGTDDGADGIAIISQELAGVRIDQITTLTYQTYTDSSPQAPALQFSIDYDLTDMDASWQGRLVFEPSNTGTVNNGVWQSWDTLAGNWWATGAPGNGVCPISSPCSLATILSNFPNAGVQVLPLTQLLVKSGSGWSGTNNTYTDQLAVTTNTGVNIIYDFEPTMAVISSQALGENGWFSDDTRADGSGTQTAGTNLISPTYTDAPEGTSMDADSAFDSDILDQIDFNPGITSPPANEWQGAANLTIDAVGGAAGKSQISHRNNPDVTLDADGFGFGYEVLSPLFSAQYSWRADNLMNPGITGALKLGFITTEYPGADMASRTGEDAWDKLLVYEPSNGNGGSADGTWQSEAVNFLTGNWWIVDRAAGISTTQSNPMTLFEMQTSMVMIGGRPVSDIWALLTDADPGDEAVLTSIQFGIGSNNPGGDVYINQLETSFYRRGIITTFGAVSDVSLTKTTTAVGLQEIGDNIEYTLTVSNTGVEPATGVQLVDTLSPSVIFLSGTCDDTTVATTGSGQATFALMDIPPGGTTVCTLQVNVVTSGNIENFATVSSANEADGAQNNNFDSVFLYSSHVESVGVTGTEPTETDNDYTRINDAVQNAVNGDLIVLEGIFDWNESNAYTSWTLGSDAVADTDDDYYILVPDMLADVTFTSAILGNAVVLGPGDLPSVDLEGFLLFNGTFNPGWEISNLMLEEFDLTLGMFFGGGSTAFNDTLINNNHIRMPRDVAGDASGESFQNIGIHFAFGTNQTISNNVIEIPGDGNSTNSFTAASVAMQSNTSGGAVYDGLVIDNNEVRVLFAQAAIPEFVLGIWENGGAHTSNITVSNNRFVNMSPANDPALNNQEGFRVHSHSSATTTTTYEGNTAHGAAIGFRWLPERFGGDLSARDPVIFTSNTAIENAIGIQVESNGAGDFSCNRIVDNGEGLLNETDAPRLSVANDNWWGCNDGPNMGLCDTAGTSLNTGTWLVASLMADSTSLMAGDMTGLTVDMTFNSGNQEVTTCTLPDSTPVAFSANAGDVTPSDTTLSAGMAMATYTALLPGGDDTAFADIDSQQLFVDFTIPLVTGTAEIVLDTGSSQDFSFDGDLGAFALDDDTDGTLPNIFTMTVPVGAYDVTQTLPFGWVLDSLVCVDPDNGSSVNGLTATLDVDEGETVTCTYTNFDGRADVTAALAASDMMPLEGDTITITADVSNDGVSDADDVQQELILPAGLTLQSTDCAMPVGPAPASVCDLGTLPSMGTATVSYTASVDMGATGPFLVQNNGSTSSAESSVANNSAFLALSVGSNEGTIVIQYVTDELSAEDVPFSGDLGAFSLDFDFDPTVKSVAVFTVGAGIYSVTQDAVAADFLFDTITCEDSSGGTMIDVPAQNVAVDLAAGEQVTCVFSSIADNRPDEIFADGFETLPLATAKHYRGSAE